MHEKIGMATEIFIECLETWIDLPNYVYTDEYKEAFINFIKLRLERENIDIVGLVYMTLDHETGNKRAYFEFDR